MKRPGTAAPAMHHTISGACPLFQAIASAMTRAFPSGSERSAEMYWNRCVEGFAAEAWRFCQSVLDMLERGACLDLCQRFFEPPDIARHDYDIRPFLRELLRRTLAHSLRGSGDEDCLQRVRRGWRYGGVADIPCP